VFGSLADNRIGVDMIIQAFNESQAVNDITFTVKRGQLDAAKALLDEMAGKLGADGVLADPDVAKVSIVGLGLMDQPGIAGRMFGELGRAGINIKMISTSDIRISCVVSQQQCEQAVKIVHDLFYPSA
ncbi:MAG TPA: ACT domain-containing protein, partial [Blastocatellia bacterium]